MRIRFRASSLLQLFAVAFVTTFVANAAADQPVQLRVLSYNIHHGAGVDGKLDLNRIARVILSADPHIVALQEVDLRVLRSQSIDQPAELARLTDMQVVFGGNIPLQGGQYGNAVLSTFPIVSHQNHLLPSIDNGEQRGVVVAEISVPHASKPLVLFATHFDHRSDDTERFASAESINALSAKQEMRSMLLAGDLNDVLKSKTLDKLESAWTRTNDAPLPTIPVTNPERQIDFILCRPAKRWKVIEVQILDEAVASDHRPILATLELLPFETPQ